MPGVKWFSEFVFPSSPSKNSTYLSRYNWWVWTWCTKEEQPQSTKKRKGAQLCAAAHSFLSFMLNNLLLRVRRFGQFSKLIYTAKNQNGNFVVMFWTLNSFQNSTRPSQKRKSHSFWCFWIIKRLFVFIFVVFRRGKANSLMMICTLGACKCEI